MALKLCRKVSNARLCLQNVSEVSFMGCIIIMRIGVHRPESRNNVTFKKELLRPNDHNPYSHIASPKFTLHDLRAARNNFGRVRYRFPLMKTPKLQCCSDRGLGLDVGDAKEINLQNDNF